jgi:hypothetical protein
MLTGVDHRSAIVNIHQLVFSVVKKKAGIIPRLISNQQISKGIGLGITDGALSGYDSQELITATSKKINQFKSSVDENIERQFNLQCTENLNKYMVLNKVIQ